MNINLADYFPITPEEINDFEHLIETSSEAPPEGGFERLMAAKEANKKLSAFQEGIAKPATFGMLVEILAISLGKDRFRLAAELKINDSTWNNVILDLGRPDILSAAIYAAFAKRFRISLGTLRSALEGSFQLIQAGISGSSAVFTRADQKTTKTADVSAAMHELLRKSGRTAGLLDSKALSFLKEIETWMKK